MSKSEVLRGFVTERLAAASQEILAAVDGLVAGYEEEASGFRQEIDRQRRLLEVLLQPRVILNKAGVNCRRGLRHDEEDNEDEYDKNLDMNNRTPSRSFSSRGQFEQRKHSGPQISETQNHVDFRIRFQENPQTEVPSKSDVQYLFLIKEEVPLELSPRLDQEKPKSPNIKEEQEELRTSQEGEQLQRLEEADDAMVPLTLVHVKTEDDEEKPQSSQPHPSRTEESRESEPPSSSSAQQMETEADGEDCGGSEPDRNLDPHGHLQPDTDEKVSESSNTEDSDIDWKETKARFKGQTNLTWHMNAHTGEKPSVSDVGGKESYQQHHVTADVKVHTGEKPFSCSVCGKGFKGKRNLNRHIKIHTGEKPFGCSVCGKTFTVKANLTVHIRVHTGETPFGCSVCGNKFKVKGALTRHMKVHTGETPFGCSVCGKRFKENGDLTRHMKVHTGEKPFCCDFCGKRFRRRRELMQHSRIHTKEKPFSCSFCGRTFNHDSNRVKHMRICKQKHVIESSSSK
ncbi:zinc finger protein 37-like [Seriola aureovittata]|uniref:zinc finger protein 37-like n=1 Tax=Seriola aureovittata TaxID=2871759 RepID=UPI0024BDD83A|nr:zinc finger protein 37-like [Seriola aureovittata]